MKICAVALIIKKLHKLGQTDLVSISMNYLKAHFDFLKGQNIKIEPYYIEYFDLL